MADVKKINEAIKRMHTLGIMPQIINDFRKNQKVYYSEPTPLGGILYWLSNEQEWEKKIREFEEKYNGLVYHVIHNYTEFGEILSLLYVSEYDEEWDAEYDDLMDGYVFAYCINLTEPMFSEFGGIAVQEKAGGLIRVG